MGHTVDNGGCSCLTGLRSPVWHRDWKQWYFLRFIVHSERTVLWTGLWLVVVQAVAYPDPMTSGISCEVRFQCTTSSAQPRSLRETPLFWFVLGFFFCFWSVNKWCTILTFWLQTLFSFLKWSHCCDWWLWMESASADRLMCDWWLGLGK